MNEPNEKAFPPQHTTPQFIFFLQKRRKVLKMKAIPHIHLGKAL